MPIKRIRACANCDTSTIVWETDKPIPGCRGFALERQVKGQTSTYMVPTWVGFKQGDTRRRVRSVRSEKGDRNIASSLLNDAAEFSRLFVDHVSGADAGVDRK
jgi:hypothetical protein